MSTTTGGTGTTRSRTPRLAATLTTLALAAALALAGCGSDTPPPTPAVTASAPTTTGAMPAPTPSGRPAAAADIAAPRVTASPKKAFTPDQVDSAWTFATTLAARYSYNPALIDTTPKQVTTQLLEPVRSTMTTSARADFDRGIRKAATDDEARGNVYAFALCGWRTDGHRVAPAGVTGVSIDGTVDTYQDGPHLVTKMAQEGVVHTLDADGKRQKVTVTKSVELYLLPHGSSWRIDGYWRKVTYGDLTDEA